MNLAYFMLLGAILMHVILVKLQLNITLYCRCGSMKSYPKTPSKQRLVYVKNLVE